jgi:hypothetical protein
MRRGRCIEFVDPWPYDWGKEFDKREHDGTGIPLYCQFPIPRRIRELVKAGALIAAEIDRLQRALKPRKQVQP